jgi:predicted lipid-binding transport protein (Tim44 family)
MRRLLMVFLIAAVSLPVSLATTPAEARVNTGLSLGSRGSHTFSAPPGTASAPNGAAPFQRSMTAPNTYGSGSSFSNYGYGRSYGMRPGSAFTSGLLGGLLGAGIGGMLFGGGFFHGMHNGSGVLGLLIQMFLLYLLASWAYRRFAGGVSMAGAGMYGRMLYPGTAQRPARPGQFGGGRTGRPISLDSSDFRSFTEVLRHIQAAWTAHDLTALRTLATPEIFRRTARRTGKPRRAQSSDRHPPGQRRPVGSLERGRARICDRLHDLLDDRRHVGQRWPCAGWQPDGTCHRHRILDLRARAEVEMDTLGDTANLRSAQRRQAVLF